VRVVCVHLSSGKQSNNRNSKTSRQARRRPRQSRRSDNDSCDDSGEDIEETEEEEDDEGAWEDDDGYDDEEEVISSRPNRRKSTPRSGDGKGRSKLWKELTSEMKKLKERKGSIFDPNDAEDRDLAAALAESRKMAGNGGGGRKRGKGSHLGRSTKRTRPPAGVYEEEVSDDGTRPEDILTDSQQQHHEQGDDSDTRHRSKHKRNIPVSVDDDSGDVANDSRAVARAKSSGGSSSAQWKTIDQWIALLTAEIVGQAVAIRKFSALLETLPVRMILGPVVALISGPSGTGKTTLIEIAARELGVFGTKALVRVSGTQFPDEASVTDICNSAKGYVGSDKEDSVMHLLRDAHQYTQEQQQQHQQASSRGGQLLPVVFVFDEIDKAHVAIWDTLMELFDRGTYGGKGTFSGKIESLFIILVANWGADEISQQHTADTQLTLIRDSTLSASRERQPPATSTAVDPYDEMREKVIADMFAAGLREHHVGRVPEIIPYTVITPADVLTGVYTHARAINSKLQLKTGINVDIAPRHQLLVLLATLVSSTQGFRPIMAAIGTVMSAIVTSARYSQHIPTPATLKILETANFPTQIDGKPITVTVRATEVTTGFVTTRPMTEWPVKLYL